MTDVDGVDLEDSPLPSDPDVAVPIEPGPVQEAHVQLPSGGALTSEEAMRITARARANVIVLAGPVSSGKTTLLATLYDQYQLGPYGGWRFASSQTVMAFEERCHDSRVASGRPEAETRRTSGGTPEIWLHLELSREEADRRISLLLTDVSGEVFDDLLNHPDRVGDLTFLSRADYVAVTVDGDGLGNPHTHHAVEHATQLLLRNLLEGEVASARLMVVLTKFDRLLAWGRDEAWFRTEIEPLWVSTAAKHGIVLETSITAARPLEAKVPWAFGVAELLAKWLRVSGSPVPVAVSDAETSVGRMMGRYRWVREAG